MFGEISMFEFEPEHVRTEALGVRCSRAEWTGFQWKLEDGWVRRLRPRATRWTISASTNLPFVEIDPPDYFKKEVRMADQMTYTELRSYVDGPETKRFRRQRSDGGSLSQAVIPARLFHHGHHRNSRSRSRPVNAAPSYGIGLCVAVGIFYWATFELVPASLAASTACRR